MLEYLVAEILSLAGNNLEVVNLRKIGTKDILRAVSNDEELEALLGHVSFNNSSSSRRLVEFKAKMLSQLGKIPKTVEDALAEK